MHLSSYLRFPLYCLCLAKRRRALLASTRKGITRPGRVNDRSPGGLRRRGVPTFIHLFCDASETHVELPPVPFCPQILRRAFIRGRAGGLMQTRKSGMRTRSTRKVKSADATADQSRQTSGFRSKTSADQEAQAAEPVATGQRGPAQHDRMVSKPEAAEQAKRPEQQRGRQTGPGCLTRSRGEDSAPNAYDATGRFRAPDAPNHRPGADAARGRK